MANGVSSKIAFKIYWPLVDKLSVILTALQYKPHGGNVDKKTYNPVRDIKKMKPRIHEFTNSRIPFKTSF